MQPNRNLVANMPDKAPKFISLGLVRDNYKRQRRPRLLWIRTKVMFQDNVKFLVELNVLMEPEISL